MNILKNRFNSPLHLSLAFILILPIGYIIYFSIAREYGSFLMLLSSSFLAWIFDMNVVSDNYIQDISFISNKIMQNSNTQELVRVKIFLSKVYIDKLLIIITTTTLILSLILLFSRNIRTVFLALGLMLLIHLVSIMFITLNFMFVESQNNIMLMIYFKMFGVNQLIVDSVYFIGRISFYYIKYFLPMFLAYWLWEMNKCNFSSNSVEYIDNKKGKKLLGYLRQNSQ